MKNAKRIHLAYTQLIAVEGTGGRGTRKSHAKSASIIADTAPTTRRAISVKVATARGTTHASV